MTKNDDRDVKRPFRRCLAWIGAAAMLTLAGGVTHDVVRDVVVVGPEQKFKSPVLDTDDAFSHTFEAAGAYKYYCSIHPRMTGQVVVR